MSSCQGCGLIEPKGKLILGAYACGHVICPNCAELHDIARCFREKPPADAPLLMLEERGFRYGLKIYPTAGLIIRVDADKIYDDGEVVHAESFVVAGDNQGILRQRILPEHYNIKVGEYDVWKFWPSFSNN